MIKTGTKIDFKKFRRLKIGKNTFKNTDLSIGLVAPSYWVSKKSRLLAKERLKHLGFSKIDAESDLFKKRYFWGGTPKQRAEVINKFFSDDSIDIIWCLRGGFASIAVLEHLDFDTIANNKKLFIGYSDITTLQLAMMAKSNLPSVQFYMPGTKNWMTSENDIKYLSAILTGSDYKAKIKDKQIYTSGFAEGQIVGGCMDLVVSSLGTPHEIDTDGKILFIEDANIPPDRFYNMLYVLKFAGKLKNLKGLIVGKIYNCKDYQEYLQLFLDELRETVTYPIIIDYKSGHTFTKIPIPLGGYCVIDTDAKETRFSFPESFKEFLPVKQ
ncbi:MAG: LD-carboxypeptidase [Candidatus Woesearchaeota archaeon]